MADKRRHWESNDFTVTKIVLEEAPNFMYTDPPKFGAALKIHLEITSVTGITQTELREDFFYSQWFNKIHSGEVILGFADTEVDRTLEKCLYSMREGELCEAALRAKFDVQRNKREKVDLKEVWIDIECKIQLESVVNADPVYKWYPETKVSKAKELNDQAVRSFKSQRYSDAFKKFRLVDTLVTFALDDLKDPAKVEKMCGNQEASNLEKEASGMKSTCLSNMAACQLQWGNFDHVIKISNDVLESNPNHVKMLYRRGVSFLERKEFDEARNDFIKAHKLEPGNKAINDKIGVLRVEEKKHKDQMSNNLKKMFA